MITLLEGYPDDVIAFEAVGEVTSADYKQTLDPAINAAIDRAGSVSVMYVLGDEFTGYSGAAMWDDAVIGTERFRHFKRIAVVTDTAWISHAVHSFAWLMPTRVKVFSVAEMSTARDWISADG